MPGAQSLQKRGAVDEKSDKYAVRPIVKGVRHNLGVFPTELDASDAYDKFVIDGMNPRKPMTSQFKGVYKVVGNKWRACARYQGGPVTVLGAWYETQEDAGAAVLKFEQDGIKVPNRKHVCPGPKGVSKYMFITWIPKSPGRWSTSLRKFGGGTKVFVDEDDAARWYNSEAPRFGRPLIEGVPDAAPDDSLYEKLKKHLF